MKLASFLLGVPLVANGLITLIQASRHLFTDWPVHAHHHVVAHISSTVGVVVVALLVLIGPLQHRERWAWWAMLAAGVTMYGGYWLGNVIVGLGEPEVLPNTSQAAQSVVYFAGLVLGWRGLTRSKAVN